MQAGPAAAGKVFLYNLCDYTDYIRFHRLQKISPIFKNKIGFFVTGTAAGWLQEFSGHSLNNR
jgi:hypothetical protein